MTQQLNLFGEVEEISPEDLKAASDKFDQIAASARKKKVIKPKKQKYDQAKIIATLTKRIESARKKASEISTEISGNWTAKRGRELQQRETRKDNLLMFAHALELMAGDWKAGTDVLYEIRQIRSITDIEFILYDGYPTPLSEDSAEWRREQYEKDLKKATRLGIRSKEESEKFKEVVAHYCTETKSRGNEKQQEINRKVNELRGSKIPGFFPTPEKVIDRMFDYANLFERREMDILEPSAGIGNIVERLVATEYDHHITCVEVNYTLNEILALKGFIPINRDILTLHNGGLKTEVFDRIIMNPPFERMQDIEHITHCYTHFLKKGGILVSVASSGAMHNTTAKHLKFQEFVNNNGQFEEMEGGMFKGAFKSTGVSTVLVILRKE